jgi:hypothetical protein
MSAKKQFGTLLSKELEESLAGRAAKAGVTISHYTEAALRQYHEPTSRCLLDHVPRGSTIVVAEENGTVSMSTRPYLMALAERHGNPSSCQAIPGSHFLTGDMVTPSMGLRNSHIVVGAENNFAGMWLQSTTPGVYRLESCSHPGSSTRYHIVTTESSGGEEGCQTIHPSPSQQMALVHQIGIIRWQRNPYAINQDARLLFLLGPDNLSTLVSVHAALSPRLYGEIARELGIDSKAPPPDFECLVYTQLFGGGPSPAQLMPSTIRRIN